MTDDDRDDYDQRRAAALSDAWMLADVLGTTTTGSRKLPVKMIRLLISTVIDQAAELESLRDRESQPVPRVIADADEAGQLPTGSIIVDDEGHGPAWIIEEETVTDAFIPGFNGRRVQGIAGFGGVRYSVVYPAVLIHTPTTTTTEGTPS